MLRLSNHDPDACELLWVLDLRLPHHAADLVCLDPVSHCAADDEIKKYTSIVAEKAPIDVPLADKGKDGK